MDDRELARRLVDLVVVSVLLDAGAGDRWRYTEEGTGQTLGRSEGLGVSACECAKVDACLAYASSYLDDITTILRQVASFHMFMAGAFSSAPGAARAKLRADSKGLQALTTEAIREGFQVVRACANGKGVGRALVHEMGSLTD